MTTNKIYDTLLYTMNKRYKGRVILINRKEKDTIILKKYTKDEQHYRENNIYMYKLHIQ